MKKRLLIMIALVCCLVLAAGILAACNSNEGTQTGGQTPGGSTPGIGDNDEVYRTVTFDLNGGDGSLAPRKYVVGELMVLPAPTRDGYRFIGWQDASGREYDDSTAMPDKNLTLYAQWEAMAGIISVEGGTIDGEEIFMLVESSVDSVSLASRVKCAEGMIWRLYHDSLGQQEIPTKIAAGKDGELDDGDNVFYIVVTSTDATQVSVYSLTIHRSYAVSVRFYDGTRLLYTDTAYTGHEYTPDYVPEIPGYAFNYWKTADGNKCLPFVPWESVSLYINKTAKNYHAVLADDRDHSLNGRAVDVTYNDDFTLPVPRCTGYSFLGWYVGDEQLTSSDGRSLDVWEYTSDQTVTAKWQINSYAVALQTNISGAGEWSGAGNYEYASKVNIKAASYLGYEFTGWYDGDRLVSEQSSYTFSLPAKDVTYTAKFVVKDEMSNYSFTSTFDACTITGIKDKTVTDITIPNSVTSIGERAFDGCTAEIIWGADPKIAEIGSHAFSGYEGTSITIPDSVARIGYEAFYGCSGLTSVTIPDSVTSIGSGAFGGCGSLRSITIPFVGAEAGKTSSDTYQYPFGYIFGTSPNMDGYGVTQYYYGSSTSSTTSTKYYIPSSLRSVTVTGGNILYGAFDNCSILTSITIPDSIIGIGLYAFDGCSGLTSITIPDSVTSIGEYAFRNCDSLTSVTIPDSVTSIGDDAFHYCDKLVEVYNKSSLNIVAGSSTYGYVGYYAKNVYTEEGGSWFTDTAGGFRFLYDGEQGYLIGYYGSETAIDLPASFTAYDGALVESYAIYKNAFEGCSGLTSITIPDSVMSIGSSAFDGCSDLTSITIPDSVMSIGKVAFSGCSGLTTVAIGDGVKSIGDHAFDGCSSLTTVTIGNGVTSIGSGAFWNCSGLTSVIIPDSVTSIGDDAFQYCSGLTTVTIGNSVTSIGSGAFYECSSLTSVSIPDSVTNIGDYAFEYCSGLTTVTIGNSVTSIGYAAFFFCNRLTSIYYSGDIASWCGIAGLGNIMSSRRTLYIDGNKVEGEIIIPDGTTSISSWALAYQTGIIIVVA